MATKKPTRPSAAAIEKEDPSGVNADREKRAELIKDAQKADADATKAAQEAADDSGLHEAKLDDEGAREQQEAAERNAPLLERDAYEGPPVVAPIIEDKLPGKFKIVAADGSGKELKDELLVTLQARVIGEDFPHPGEVIIDVKREDGQDHQRFSTYTYDGQIDVGLMGINGPGTWVFHAESQVTQVGDGRDDHLPVIRQSGERKLIVR